jgi:hypothetical protein
MATIYADTRQHILDDPDTNGDLFRSIYRDSDVRGEVLEFIVGSDMSIAPYAAVVEWGSGRLSNTPFPESENVPSDWPADSSSTPDQYPFDAPSIGNISGFAYYIEQWMRDKGIEPDTGSYRLSALKIAETINKVGTFAHPYLRPAYFDNERELKKAARKAVTNATR